MKKNGLTLAVAAGLMTVGSIADAVHINPDGTGQVLIYPYYTVQSGNQTALSIVNTTGLGKAVKVRFLEGRNSREVLDFNLYLSPYDVWTGTVFAPPAGSYNEAAAGLVTDDRSCTAPDIVRGGFGYAAISPGGGDVCTYDMGRLPDDRFYAGFRPFEFMPDSVPPVANPSQCAANAAGILPRTREGYFEVIQMGDIDPDSDLFAWSLHNAAGEPGNCEGIVDAWAAREYDNARADEVLPTMSPGGGLFGNAMIVKPSNGTILGYTADALDDYRTASIHRAPGDIEPSLQNVQDADPNVATARVFVGGTLLTATYDNATAPGNIDAVSALFATRRVSNEYYLDESEFVTGTSEWVLTFPTKRFYVDNDPSYDFDNPPSYTGPAVAPDAPYAPFTQAFQNGACETLSVTTFDREEQSENLICDVFPVPPECGFSPPRPGQESDSICWESQVITFNQAGAVAPGGQSNILGATYAQNVTTPHTTGWANVNFPAQAMRPSVGDGYEFQGLPVTGFFATNYDNGVLANNTGGVLANYSALFHHRMQRECEVEGGICS